MSFDIPIIALGNLSTGGTGKTPHVEYILSLFPDKKWVVLSRGYGRKSKGFFFVDPQGLATDYGDEPLQIAKKFPSVPVAVCEDRVLAIPQILAEYPETEAILLDDAYQHRYLKAKAYILLTTASQPYFKDSLLPSGNLREPIAQNKRAHAVVLTKNQEFPEDSSPWRKDLQLGESQSLFFSQFVTDQAKNLEGEVQDSASFQDKEVFVFSAIAGGSEWAEAYLSRFRSKLGELTYRDHHAFSIHDIRLLKSKLKEDTLVLTTEKDAMRLQKFRKELQGIHLIYYPIQVKMKDEPSFKEFLSGLLD